MKTYVSNLRFAQSIVHIVLFEKASKIRCRKAVQYHPFSEAHSAIERVGPAHLFEFGLDSRPVGVVELQWPSARLVFTPRWTGAC